MVLVDASPGGATALARAAVATTVAGVGAAMTYWATMEDETTGDFKVLTEGKGTLRLMSTNLRRVKGEQSDGNEMAERVWIDTLKAVEEAGFDVWAIQDADVDCGAWGFTWASSAVECREAAAEGELWMGWYEDGVDTPAMTQGGQGSEKRRHTHCNEGGLEGRDAPSQN